MTEGTRRFAVLIPTTGAVLHLRALVPRPGLPHGAAFAEGDYRPLPLSTDYRALAGPEGPIARHLGGPLVPHELRLSGAPDSGRSWEAPVVIAHLLLADGWTLVQADDDPDLTVWATGAVDLDLRLLEGDYALGRKVDVSAPSLTGSVLVVLPPDQEQSAAKSALSALGADVKTPKTLKNIVPTSDAPALAPAKTQPKRGILLGGLVFAVFAAAIAFALTRSEPQEITENTDETQEIVEDTITIIEPVESEEVPAPSIRFAGVYAAADSSCRAALFDLSKQVQKEVTWDAQTGFAPLTYAPDLCGIAVLTDGTQPPPDPTTTPPDALIEASLSDQARVLFLRPTVQNLVYTVPDPSAAADAAPLRHEIVKDDP